MDRKPTVEEVRAARGSRVPDVLRKGLDIVFCGINPGLYSGAVGAHFARPGNRFWRALSDSGLTDRVLGPRDEDELLSYGLGITNLVNRATAVAAELSDEELRRGRGVLKRKIGRYRPKFVAILGIGAYRAAFEDPDARPGPQDERLHGARVWLLPNPSGLNAHYQRDDLAKLFSELRERVRGD
ncbi:MAG: G/U mismatch-specific DNA glycosylase [Candidatus Eisenbacteria bacterium]|nr:G/U mismatch-specific DNA glycosylase [Candidatus Eisenbacteria bacterium]